MTSPPSSTGNRLVWWLLTLVTSILIMAGAAWATAVTTRQQALEDRNIAIAEQQRQLDRRLGVIEGKIDLIIDQTTPRHR